MQQAVLPRKKKQRIARDSREQVCELLGRIRSGCALSLAEYVRAEDLLASLSHWQGGGESGFASEP